ncbi:uncharacterized protein J3R85_013659 [Psidium guajava]|nr:uncharacterized protein J3R85_013659 [Psidium guajava]
MWPDMTLLKKNGPCICRPIRPKYLGHLAHPGWIPSRIGPRTASGHC